MSPTSRFATTAIVLCAGALAGCQAPPPDTAPQTGEHATHDAAAPAETLHYQCGELALGARFDTTANQATLDVSGRLLTLPAAVAASGARYADDLGNSFHGKGQDDATLVLQGEQPRTCTRTEHVSPWTLARTRGVVFRAVGQEPGWLVEVDDTALHAQLDYGQRTLTITPLTALQDNGLSGYAGTAGSGEQVRLEISAETCVDGMSGERFASTARLQVDAQVYSGCGAVLSP